MSKVCFQPLLANDLAEFIERAMIGPVNNAVVVQAAVRVHLKNNYYDKPGAITLCSTALHYSCFFGKCLNPWATTIRRSWTQAASIEETLALWAASLREIKKGYVRFSRKSVWRRMRASS